MDTIKDRLIYLWRDNPKPTIIAREIGMSSPGFNRIWYNDGLPNTETLIKIQESTGCNLNWLLTGKGEPYIDKSHPTNAGGFDVANNGEVFDTLGNPVDLSEFIFIPRYDIYAAAGHGYPVDTDKPQFPMAFRRYWVENYVTRQIDKLSVIVVKGNSMEGVLSDGDNILVNHTKTDPNDGLYVLRIGSDLFVKNIQRLPSSLLVKSANPLYEPFEIDLTDDSIDVQIIGRVEWYGRRAT